MTTTTAHVLTVLPGDWQLHIAPGGKMLISRTGFQQPPLTTIRRDREALRRRWALETRSIAHNIERMLKDMGIPAERSIKGCTITIPPHGN